MEHRRRRGALTLLLAALGVVQTVRKVAPCVLEQHRSKIDQRSLHAARAHEGQRDNTHHRHLHTQSTPRWSKCPRFFRPPMHNKGGGHLPFGAQSNHVEECAGARHLKPTLQNAQRPSKQVPLKGLSAGVLQTFLRRLSEGLLEH